MTTYIKIKPETEAYEIMYNCYNYPKKWHEHDAELEKFLGFKTDKILYYNTSILTIDRKALPKDWEDQFKKGTYPAEAKVKSKINKEWVELCKKLDLKVHQTRDFLIKYALMFRRISYHSMNDNYYLEITDDREVKFDTKVYSWAEEVTEADFLRLRADYLDKKTKGQLVTTS